MSLRSHDMSAYRRSLVENILRTHSNHGKKIRDIRFNQDGVSAIVYTGKGWKPFTMSNKDITTFLSELYDDGSSS